MRGDGLSSLSLYEYCGFITIVPKKESNRTTSFGRTGNGIYE